MHIIEHNGIRKQNELSETFDMAASMIGSPVNTLKLANTFKTLTKKDITDSTIATFISYFEDAFLISSRFPRTAADTDAGEGS